MPKSAIFAWPVAGQHHVGRLDVAMHDAALVAELQPGEQVLHDPHRVGEREALLLVEQRLQRRAVDELHDDVGEVVGLAVVEHADDVGVGQPAGRLRLAAEAGQRLLGLRIGIIGQLDGLDRDAAGDDRVPALIDGAHGTAAERPLDLVLAESLDRLHPLRLPPGAYRPARRRGETRLSALAGVLAALADHRERRPEERMRDLRRQTLCRRRPAWRAARRAARRRCPMLGFSRIRRSVSATRNAATWSFTDQCVTTQRARAGVEEGAGQAGQAFARRRAAGTAGVAGRQDDQVGVQVEPDDRSTRSAARRGAWRVRRAPR